RRRRAAPRRSGHRGAEQPVNLSRQFILRPVATTLLMAALLLGGALAYRLLPVSALPQVDYPTIQVFTFYPGASPDVMASSATAPLPPVEYLADTRLAQKIAQLPGVGLVSISGGQRPAVRVQANPAALSAYSLTLEDLRGAVAAANVNQAKGSFDGPRQSSVIGANDQLLTSRDYKPLIIAYRN